MLRRFEGIAVLLLATLAANVALAQVHAPPPPAEYKVWLRYRIRAARIERPGHFYNLLDNLEERGFKKDAGPENEEADTLADRMTGTIASANARKLLSDPRVQALVLAPAGFTFPDDPETPVKVQLELLPGLMLERQRALVEQLRPLLVEQGFQEALGYDHRGHTRLVGTVPGGKVPLLLQDLRWQAAGWFVPETQVADLPMPLRNRWPLVVTEITPEPADIPPAKDAAVVTPAEEHLRKLTPEVRALPTPEGEAARRIRLEIILARVPADEDAAWPRVLEFAAPGLRVEGRLGQIVTALGRPEHAAQVALLPHVSTVRLPRVAHSPRRTATATKERTRDLMLESGLERLHNLGHRGGGVRIAIVDRDFRGHASFVGKQLPATTRLVDLTTERNPDLVPDPDAGTGLGAGTEAALAAALAAPDAELILVRIDPAAPYMVREAARWIGGAPVRSLTLTRRTEELDADTERISLRWDVLNDERQFILNSFGQDEASVKRRAEFVKKEAKLTRDEAALDARRARYLQLRRDLAVLKGIHIIALNLTWDAGHPVDGTGGLSRFLDDVPQQALWVQAASGTRGQVWAGPFQDADGNGVLEFAGTDDPLRKGRWTRELNFLGWQDRDGTDRAELPAKARIRVSVQWREPHDPEFFHRGEDLYRVPLANPRLLILRQRDPSGAKLPADALEVAGRSVDLPQRLLTEAGYAVYEQTVEFLVETAGVYALRVEGRQPTDIRPVGVPGIPAIQQTWELRPRAIVQVLDGVHVSAGRPVFVDYRTNEGTLGMPADARSTHTIGAASESSRARAASATGPVLNLELLPKPDALVFDSWYIEGAGTDGASLAVPFAAGQAASALSAGTAATPRK